MSNVITPITVAYGDGIGPEIMHAVIYILKEVEAKIRIEIIEIGEKLYLKHYNSGIAEDTWDNIKRTKILFKAPITTPQGGGYKSLNVTLRKSLGLFANVRPTVSYHPFVHSLHPKLDVVIIRENEEDLYAGIEYRHTRNMRESMKLISRTGCEKIIRYAFEYAVRNKRRKVTCFTKDNIMKFSDGLFHEVFNEIASEYPQINNENYLIDIGTARLAVKPEIFDVIVTSNLFGDIISDVTAEISGSVGLAGSANIGENFAMFEAIHGSAPDIANKDIANPSGLLNAAIMMLVHINQGDTAAIIENAWKKTLEDGIHTADIYQTATSTKKVSTMEFTKAIVQRLGQIPSILKIADYTVKDILPPREIIYAIDDTVKKKLVGVDIYIDFISNSVIEIHNKIKNNKNISESKNKLKLQTISAKGLILWPGTGHIAIDHKLLSDHWCCRFMPGSATVVTHQMIADLLKEFVLADIDFIKVENLYEFDGKRGYSLAQGE